MFRTSDAAGIEKIYLCGITPAPIDVYKRENAHLTKVSLGAEHSVAWEQREDVVMLLKELQSQGCSIIAVEQSERSIPYSSLTVSDDQKRNAVLVMGNEVDGLSLEVLVLADYVVDIPMKGQKESLNVAVAFGIVAFHLMQ